MIVCARAPPAPAWARATIMAILENGDRGGPVYPCESTFVLCVARAAWPAAAGTCADARECAFVRLLFGRDRAAHKFREETASLATTQGQSALHGPAGTHRSGLIHNRTSKPVSHPRLLHTHGSCSDRTLALTHAQSHRRQTPEDLTDVLRCEARSHLLKYAADALLLLHIDVSFHSRHRHCRCGPQEGLTLHGAVGMHC